RLEQLDPALTGIRAERNHLIALQQESARDFRRSLPRSQFAQLVSLGQSDDRGHFQLRQKVQHSSIIIARVAPNVQQQHYTPKLRGSTQVALDERPPPGFLFLGDAGVTIAGQIYEDEGVVDPKEVDLARAAWCATHPGERFSSHQRVEQRGLADVRSPGESDLRE